MGTIRATVPLHRPQTTVLAGWLLWPGTTLLFKKKQRLQSKHHAAFHQHSSEKERPQPLSLTPNHAVTVSAVTTSYMIYLLSGYTEYIYLYLGISIFIIDTYFKSHGLSGNCADLFTCLWFLTKTDIFKHLQK